MGRLKNYTAWVNLKSKKNALNNFDFRTQMWHKGYEGLPLYEKLELRRLQQLVDKLKRLGIKELP